MKLRTVAIIGDGLIADGLKTKVLTLGSRVRRFDSETEQVVVTVRRRTFGAVSSALGEYRKELRELDRSEPEPIRHGCTGVVSFRVQEVFVPRIQVVLVPIIIGDVAGGGQLATDRKAFLRWVVYQLIQQLKSLFRQRAAASFPDKSVLIKFQWFILHGFHGPNPTSPAEAIRDLFRRLLWPWSPSAIPLAT